jgi:putative transposase
VSRYRCVDAQKAAGFPVVAACQAARVIRSAYYAWTASGQGPSSTARDEASLVAEIRRIHVRSCGTYGAPRVHAELRRRRTCSAGCSTPISSMWPGAGT